MWFDVYTQGILIGLVASVPLGPIGLLCIQRTLSKSHRSGFVSGLGAATADSMFATVALFSLGFDKLLVRCAPRAVYAGGVRLGDALA